jgi:uncharacterized protein
MVFVDTGVWFAHYVPSDPNHARVQDWFRLNRAVLLTTDYCVDETLTLLINRRRPAKAVEVGRMFFHANRVQIHFVTENQIHRAWILFQQRAAAGWSFTDCTSKIVIDDLGIRTAAALDDHFRQFGNVIVVP